MNGIVNIFGALLQFIIIIIISRIYGVAGLGEYAIILGVISPVFILFSFSLKHRFFSGEFLGNETGSFDVLYLRSFFFLIAGFFFILAILFDQVFLSIAILVKLIEFHLDDALVFQTGSAFLKTAVTLIVSFLIMLFMVMSDDYFLLAPFSLLILSFYWLQKGLQLVRPDEVRGIVSKGIRISSVLLLQNLIVIGQRYIVAFQLNLETVGLFTIVTNILAIASILFQSAYIQLTGFYKSKLLSISICILLITSPLTFLFLDDVIHYIFAAKFSENVSLIIITLCALVFLDYNIIIKAIGESKKISMFPNIFSFLVFLLLTTLFVKGMVALLTVLIISYVVRVILNYYMCNRVQ
jgi:hypothetical protein